MKKPENSSGSTAEIIDGIGADDPVILIGVDLAIFENNHRVLEEKASFCAGVVDLNVVERAFQFAIETIFFLGTEVQIGSFCAVLQQEEICEDMDTGYFFYCDRFGKNFPFLDFKTIVKFIGILWNFPDLPPWKRSALGYFSVVPNAAVCAK